MTWRVGIDVGGTFTDLVAVDEQTGQHLSLKVFSTSDNSANGFLAALAELRTRAALRPGDVGSIFHGTTTVTNAIIERRLRPTALVTTKGFRDVLEIGRHWRPDLYDLTYRQPPPLISRGLRFEVDERMSPDGDVERPLDPESVDAVLAELAGADVEAVAVVLLHSYLNPEHEEELARRLRDAFPTAFVCTSAELSREPREFERTATTVLNAALMPSVDTYLSTLETELGREGEPPPLYLIHSNGGAISAAAARGRPVGLAQSGPVAGVRACLDVGDLLGRENIIGFDMGGTSADIALIEGGEPRLATEVRVGGLPVRLPSIEVHSIGAGGGSLATLDEVGALQVGPMSAGSDPGPACYGRGGTRPTITDCNLALGRIPSNWPLAGFLRLDLPAAERAVREHVAEPLGLSVREAAQGVLDVVNASMEGSIRIVLRERGNDPRDFALVSFGGAGSLHAVELASRLSIGTVIVPRHPGTFSAHGLTGSDLRHDFVVSHAIRSDDADAEVRLESAFAELEALAQTQLAGDPDFAGTVVRERRCDVRYLGQAYEVSVPFPAETVSAQSFATLVADFHELHERTYAFAEWEERCEIRSQRLFLTKPVRSVAAGNGVAGEPDTASAAPQPSGATVVFEGQELSCPVIRRDTLLPGASVPAPCVIVQEDATTFIPPAVTVTVAPSGDLLITDIPAR